MTDQNTDASAPLILASSSRYRRELLDRLGLPFDSAVPDIDEKIQPDENPMAAVARLAAAKARAIALRQPESYVIGSDQVAVIGTRILGKSGGFEAAREQLTQASGRSVRFLTGLCLIDPKGQEQIDVIPFTVQFRELPPWEIERYLEIEQPFDCAGSFKSEGLGVTLFESMSGSDPTALVGLPLIRLCDMLRRSGLNPLTACRT